MLSFLCLPVFWFSEEVGKFIMNRKNERYREHIHMSRYNEGLTVKTDGSTLLVYTGLCEELEHPKDRGEVKRRED